MTLISIDKSKSTHGHTCYKDRGIEQWSREGPQTVPFLHGHLDCAHREWYKSAIIFSFESLATILWKEELPPHILIQVCSEIWGDENKWKYIALSLSYSLPIILTMRVF